MYCHYPDDSDPRGSVVVSSWEPQSRTRLAEGRRVVGRDMLYVNVRVMEVDELEEV